jgi:hypothetical protein
VLTDVIDCVAYQLRLLLDLTQSMLELVDAGQNR